MTKNRSIVLCIVFSIITCGIYELYWIYKLAQETNIITNHTQDTGPGMVLLLGIVTCGIYLIYWAYKTGEKFNTYSKQIQVSSNDNYGILYLILMIGSYLTGGICMLICFGLMQDYLNKLGQQYQYN
ncbi:MAG: DUF4234 domain-containing protein [Coriobacteriales bacterium]|nr:DUF4234 domain-containing protein [Coriobacteriales bacterium]